MGATKESWIKRKANGNGIAWNKGLTKSDPRVAKYSQGHSERMTGKRYSAEVNAKKGRSRIKSIEERKKIADSKRGSKSHFWKGGLTEINKIIRQSVEYKLWREAVFKRDNWTCVFCGKRGVEIHPDHIKPFALFPELRFAIDNGRTLCFDCHKLTPTYGVRSNKVIS